MDKNYGIGLIAGFVIGGAIFMITMNILVSI